MEDEDRVGPGAVGLQDGPAALGPVQHPLEAGHGLDGAVVQEELLVPVGMDEVHSPNHQLPLISRMLCRRDGPPVSPAEPAAGGRAAQVAGARC